MDEYLLRNADKKSRPLWDSFKDLEPEKNTGSVADWTKYNIIIKIFKITIYIITFILILASSVFSKLSYVLMAGHVDSKLTNYCSISNPKKSYTAKVSQNQIIFWIWILIFSFITPELLTFLRMARICIFKKVEKAFLLDIIIVSVMECLHTIGVSVFTFLVIPRINSLQAVMLMNCINFIPSILILTSSIFYKKVKQIIILLINVIVLFVQIIGLGLWSFEEIWFLPIATILISCRWWENYASYFNINHGFNFLTELRLRLTKTRPRVYIFIAPLKILVFIIGTFLINGHSFISYFNTEVLKYHIEISENNSLYTDEKNTALKYESFLIESSLTTHLLIFFIHIVTSYLCYVFSKFACKIKIQEFSFALPVSINVPTSLIILEIICELRNRNVCALNGLLPDYLSFTSFSYYTFNDFITNKYMYIWLFWWLSQLWITRHIWKPLNDKNASTEKLFIEPWYFSFMIDQCVMMNRRCFDKEFFLELMDSVTVFDHTKINDDIIQNSDNIPKLIVCATMWHETEAEMIEFLKSIIRLDEDQCSRRIAKKYFEHDEEYYEFESHIFFDDAFIKCGENCISPNRPPVNDYVKLLVKCLPKALRIVYDSKIITKKLTKIEAPYGGQLAWTLPGDTRLIVHLKDNEKIRNKKRWSQVMYMYYLLGYKIMEMNISPERKAVIAQNTFLLALDGDIDFQPKAVQLLIGRMKVNPNLGAACGRIHPVGKGPMVWYQIFEYAIGHWLQKATEHVIGCVLCSPGCFSLFRGRALMENSVMKKYTTISERARHYVQFDQGEDRWLCTLLLKQKFRVEYSAASDAYTHAPETFNEFYNQRRRWIPSTMANIMDLLGNAKNIVKNNDNISLLYIIYQGMLLAGSILGPGTIFLMVIGALATVFNMDIWTSFLYNFIPIFSFIIVCIFTDQKYQLSAAFVISTIYCLVMMAVLIGIIVQVIEDSVLSPASLFFLSVAGQICITGLLHPKEAGALLCGIIYYITIPSMYLLLLIYSVLNMDDVSWGTRDTKYQTEKEKEVTINNQKSHKSKLNILKQFKKESEEGSLDFSFAGLFRCMFCLRPKTNTTDIHLMELATKIDDLEKKISQGKKEEEQSTEQQDILSGSGQQVNTIQNDENPADWINDPIFQKFQLDELISPERKFWKSLIKKYLYPLSKTDKEKEEIRAELKELRNVIAFAFIMMNALFVLVVLLLQVKKNYLHLEWPFNSKDEITFDDNTFEVTIYREHLKLDPIGLCFVIFFGTILAIQFISMLIHRFGTISQILANTELNIFGSNVTKNELSAIKNDHWTNPVEIAKKAQRPSNSNKDSDSENEECPADSVVRFTILKCHEFKENVDIDYSNLQENFKRRLNQGKLKIKNALINKKSVMPTENRDSLLNNNSRIVKTLREDGCTNPGYISHA